MSSDLDIALARLARALETRQKRPRATAQDSGADLPLPAGAGGTGGDPQPVAEPARSTTDADGWVDRFLDE